MTEEGTAWWVALWWAVSTWCPSHLENSACSPSTVVGTHYHLISPTFMVGGTDGCGFVLIGGCGGACMPPHHCLQEEAGQEAFDAWEGHACAFLLPVPY